jgi:CRISPR-associated endoribonuclease Cas6
MIVEVKGILAENAVISTFSGAIAQSIVLSLLNNPGLHGMRPKPFTVWPLVVDGKPLWDRGIINSGALLELRVAFLDRALGEEFFSIMASTRRFRLFKSEVVIDTISAREVRLISSSSSAFRVEFLSPTRFETPPYVKRPAPVYDLTPRPLNLFKSAVKTAMRLGLVDARWARRFLRWAYASVGVADFGCRGRCVVSVRLSGGRRLRGFVGWALYRAFETSMLEDMWRMLSVAVAFGVGSNRPLGFGAVRITPLQ